MVNWVNSTQSRHIDSISHILYNIFGLKVSFISMKIKHVFTKQNKIFDMLSKEGLRLDRGL